VFVLTLVFEREEKEKQGKTMFGSFEKYISTVTNVVSKMFNAK